MKIPDKVKVGGIIYDVVITKMMPGGKDEMGNISYPNARILIRPTKEPGFMKAVLLHEIFHAIFEQACLEQDEELIDRLSYGLAALIEDNPEMWEAEQKIKNEVL